MEHMQHLRGILERELGDPAVLQDAESAIALEALGRIWTSIAVQNPPPSVIVLAFTMLRLYQRMKFVVEVRDLAEQAKSTVKIVRQLSGEVRKLLRKVPLHVQCTTVTWAASQKKIPWNDPQPKTLTASR